MTSRKVVGYSLPRVDGIEKVTGNVIYGPDVRLPHMLYGKVLRSPFPHARILRIDTSRSEALPGVVAVITIKDVPQHLVGLHQQGGHHIFAKDRVRYIGDEVAAVAAVDEETAEKALQSVDVEYEELPAVFDTEAAMRQDAPLTHEDVGQHPMVRGGFFPEAARTTGEGSNVSNHYKLRKGDLEKGFLQADYIVEDTFKVHNVHHGYIEPHACVASWHPSGKVTVWVNSQRPFAVRSYLSQAFKLPESKVRVINTRVGGGFGGKAGPDFARFAVALSMRTGRPVKTVLTRTEEFELYHNPACVTKIKVGARKNGRIEAIRMEVIWDTGSYATAFPYPGVVPGSGAGPYSIPNVSIDSYLVYTNKAPTFAWRGLAMPAPTFAVESALDMLAEKIGMDAYDLRMKNLFAEGDTNAAGQVIHSVGARECFEKAAKAISWGKKPEPNCGIGLVSFHKYVVNAFPSSAVIKLNEDGTVMLICGAPELGQGTETALSQMVAEEMGVRFEDVTFSHVDTDVTPYDWGAISERTTVYMGKAISRAAADAREQMLKIAEQMLEVGKEALSFDESYIFVKDAPERRIPRSKVYAASHVYLGGPIIGKGSYIKGTLETRNPETGQETGPAPAWKYGAHAVELKVDPETGAVKLLRYVAAHDVGFAVNPLILEGHFEGGTAMGIGLAMSEETIYDSGKITNPGFMDYRVLTSAESIDVEPIIVEVAGDGPFGVKGGSELGPVGVAPAIANAVYRATGVRIKELPITPEKIWKALEKKANRL